MTQNPESENKKVQQALHWLEYAEIEFAEAGIAAEVIKHQAAQIAGLKANVRYWTGEIDTVLAGRADEHDRAEAAEADAATLRAEVERLRDRLARMEERAVLWVEQGMVIVVPEGVPQRMALDSYRKQFAALVRAALTDPPPMEGKHE